MRKVFFTLLIGASFAFASYFSFRALQETVRYFSLQQEARAQIVRWEIREVDGKFPISAFYQFEYQGKSWSGFTRLSPPWNLNEPAAVQDLQKNQMQKKWTVWFDPKDPTHSSLEKKIPTNWIIRTILSVAVVVYFLIFMKRISRIVFN